MFYNSGQLTAAEQFIDETCRDPRSERTGVRVLLVPVADAITNELADNRATARPPSR
jgi:hypothetical protein